MQSVGGQESVAPEALASGDSWTWERGGNRGGPAIEADTGPSPEEIRTHLDAARKPVLIDRAKVALGSVILITIVFLVMTLAAGNPFGTAPQVVRILNLTVVLAVWAALRPARSVEALEWMILVAVAFSCVCAGIVSSIEGEPLNSTLGLVAVTLGTATFLPWRIRMQVVLVSISALTLVASYVSISRHLPFITMITSVTVIGTFICTVYMVLILQDVRRRGVIGDLLRRRAEENLRIANEVLEERVEERTTELKTAMHELELFNYSVSHDLRSPLRVINGMTQLIEEELAANLDEVTAARFARVKLATRRLGELMDAILARSRVSQAEMHPASINLRVLGDSVIAELRADHPEREVVWTRPDKLMTVADAVLLRLVLENLLDNSWKFTRGRESARIELGVTDGSRSEFYVRDNGVGFDKRHATKLFENFQRFHGEEYEGHGIGLAMARRIIERHGGSIRAETEPDAGTTIFFTLGAGRQ